MRNKIQEWLQGSVTLAIRGQRFERLLNMAVRQGFRVWNIRRHGTQQGECEMAIRDYLRIRPLLRETGCRSKVIGRHGLPFVMLRLRVRSGLLIGPFLFLFGLYMLSSLIWQVEVIGTKQISVAKVQQIAENVGIKQWAWKETLKEPHLLQRAMLEELPDASWIGVEIKGTKAIIEVVEKNQPEPSPPNQPRHLVAKKKAVIHRIMAESGKTVVAPNQLVNKGQILVSGVIGNEERQSAVAARGKVEGEVWYVTDAAVPLEQVHYQYTGEQEQGYYLLAGSYAVRLWPFQAQPFERFEQSEERQYLSIGSYSFPLGWKQEVRRAMEPVKRLLTPEQAVQLAKQFAREDVLRQAGKDATIEAEKVLHQKQENGKVYLRIHYTVIEDIAEEQPFTALPPAPSSGMDQ